MDNRLIEIGRKIFFDKKDKDYCLHYNWENESRLIEILTKPVILEEWEEEYYSEMIVRECLEGIMFEDIGICGCGLPEETYILIQKTLEISEMRHKTEWSVDKYKQIEALIVEEFGKYGCYQFFAYILDDKGFLEHGGSIGGCWMTEDGKDLLYLLRNFDFENNDL